MCCCCCVLRFLGVCPWERVPAIDAHKSGTSSVPASHRLNRTCCQLLHAFYEPFTALLDDMLGRPSGYGDEACPID